MNKHGYVYIMTNKHSGTLYTGVTSNLIKRIREHKNGIHANFTSKYQCHQLVYYEEYNSITEAITREKQIKAGSRKDKILLIESINKHRHDLSHDRDMTQF